MRRFPSIKDLTREQIEEYLDKAAEKFLRSRAPEARKEVIELHDRLMEFDLEKKQVPIPVLQLRDHRLMKRASGYVIWPPAWARVGDNNAAPLTGEIGRLEQVLLNEAVKESIFLLISHEGFNYMGSMTFDDRMFCRQLSEFLKSKIGLSIKEIGDLDLSHWL